MRQTSGESNFISSTTKCNETIEHNNVKRHILFVIVYYLGDLEVGVVLAQVDDFCLEVVRGLCPERAECRGVRSFNIWGGRLVRTNTGCLPRPAKRNGDMPVVSFAGSAPAAVSSSSSPNICK